LKGDGQRREVKNDLSRQGDASVPDEKTRTTNGPEEYTGIMANGAGRVIESII